MLIMADLMSQRYFLDRAFTALRSDVPRTTALELVDVLKC
jgi:hypothetical protein